MIAGGYVAAFAAALVATYLNDLRLQADPITYASGMAAGGQLILFCGVFAVVALAPSGYALYLLRRVDWFWRLLSPACLVLAGTNAVAATTAILTSSHAVARSIWPMLGSFAVLRILATPAFAPAFGMAALAAPTRGHRRLLFTAALVEFVAGATWLLTLHR